MRGPLRHITKETYLPKGRGRSVLISLDCGHLVVRAASHKPKQRCRCAKCEAQRQGVLFDLHK